MIPLSAAEFASQQKQCAAPQAPASYTDLILLSEDETREPLLARFARAETAFPNPLPTIPVQLPGDGSPEAITAYFNRTYGVKPANRTAERAQRLCAKLAADPRQEEYQEVGRWWEAWERQRKNAADS